MDGSHSLKICTTLQSTILLSLYKGDWAGSADDTLGLTSVRQAVGYFPRWNSTFGIVFSPYQTEVLSKTLEGFPVIVNCDLKKENLTFLFF